MSISRADARKVLDKLPDEEDAAFVRDTLRIFELDRPTFSYGLREAINDGYLVPYQIYRAVTVKTAAEGGFEVRRDELDWSAMDDQTRAEFEGLFAGSDTIVVDPNALERRFTIPSATGPWCASFARSWTKAIPGRGLVRRQPLVASGVTVLSATDYRSRAP